MTITVAQIIAITAREFGLTPDDIKKHDPSHHTSPRAVVARQTAMKLARDMTDKTYPCLGRIFNRHYSTVMVSVARWPTTIRRRRFEDEARKAIAAVLEADK